MKNILILLFFSVKSLVTYAQERPSSPTSFVKNKAKAQIQFELNTFITKNWKSYVLTPAKIEEVKKIHENSLIHKHEDSHENEHTHEEKSDAQKLENLLEEAKRFELRKLFFQQNPDKKEILESKFRVASNENSSKTANKLASGVTRYACDNGGFEEVIIDNYKLVTTDDYDFYLKSYTVTSIESIDEKSDRNINFNFAPLNKVNEFSYHLSLVKNDPIQYDPTLASQKPPTYIPVAKSGAYAIKLNNANSPMMDSYVSTKMTKTFIASSSKITYSFLFICENPRDNHPLFNQPRFLVRLLDKNGSVISQNDLVSNVDNTFSFKIARPETKEIVNPDGTKTPARSPLIYTDWQCASLDLKGIINEEVTLEFSVNDCTQGGHFGTVYIDDICTNTNCKSSYGEINLNFNDLNLGNCPKFPLDVCGTFTAPFNINNPNEFAPLKTIKLNILKDNNIVSSVIQPKNVTNNLGGAENTFCFELNESNFGVIPNTNVLPTGDFEFQVEAVFNTGGIDFPKSVTSAKVGPDVSFNDCTSIDCCSSCCPEHQLVTEEVKYNFLHPKQAQKTLTAQNKIDNGGTSLYHAGEMVTFTSPFDAVSGSILHAYIEGCTEMYQQKENLNNSSNINFSNSSTDEIALIKIEDLENSDIIISPNPNTGLFKISIFNEVNSGQIKIFDLNGRTLFEQSVNQQNEVEIDMTNNASGIYIIQLSLGNEIITKKIIKE
jgi:hypothetical protein